MHTPTLAVRLAGMSEELPIGPKLIGQQVALPGRPEWGVGTVLRVQSTTVAGQPRHRVSIQFATGHRTLLVPPARLCSPVAEQEREVGWLESVSGQTLDERLWKLPETITEFLGTHAQRLAVLASLYIHADDAASLVQWARRQTQVADPLTLWSRDELGIAFGKFCNERDAELRVTAARLKHSDGPEALEAALSAQPGDIQAALRAALRKPI
ncbi:MAG: DUF3553 domain-containing protein [Planctomycetota bacterium]